MRKPRRYEDVLDEGLRDPAEAAAGHMSATPSTVSAAELGGSDSLGIRGAAAGAPRCVVGPGEPLTRGLPTALASGLPRVGELHYRYVWRESD